MRGEPLLLPGLLLLLVVVLLLLVLLLVLLLAQNPKLHPVLEVERAPP
jgi:hypothetical protein